MQILHAVTIRDCSACEGFGCVDCERSGTVTVWPRIGNLSPEQVRTVVQGAQGGDPAVPLWARVLDAIEDADGSQMPGDIGALVALAEG